MRSHIVLIAFLLAAAGSGTAGQSTLHHSVGAVDDKPWAREIAAFKAADTRHFPKPGGVVFVGSSSIALWPHLARDFPRARVIQRGFGGSELADVVYRAPEIVVPYKPRLVVVYAGDNDLANGRSPEEVLARFQEFVGVVRRSLPNTRIAFISIKPSWARVSLLEKMRETNERVRRYIEHERGLIYVDVFSQMLSPEGYPRARLLAADSLHMNEAGYRLWRHVLTPIVSKKRHAVLP